MDNFVLQIDACDTCQQRGQGLLKVTNTLKQIKIVSKAWYLLGMDLIGPLKKTAKGNEYILTVVDYFTKWIEAAPIRRTPSLWPKHFMNTFIAAMGLLIV
jgi:hypothetical protein